MSAIERKPICLGVKRLTSANNAFGNAV